MSLGKKYQRPEQVLERPIRGSYKDECRSLREPWKRIQSKRMWWVVRTVKPHSQITSEGRTWGRKSFLKRLV